jgi:hypothetical protein
MKIKKLLPFTLAFVIAGCVPSLHSLFTEKDTFFDPQLAGIWTSNDKEIWQFAKKPDSNSYEVIYTDKDENRGSFVGTLGKINDMTFLDLFPDNSLMEIHSNGYYQAHLVPAHTFMKIEQIHPTLKMRAMDPDKTRDMLKNDPNLLKFELIDDNRAVITASTQQLQQFMKEHANDKGLFGEPTELKRLMPTEPNAPDANKPHDASNEIPV